MFLSQFAMADQWFCTTESGQRDDNKILACGIGDALNNESLARILALKRAIEEFKMICDISADCIGRKYIVIPKRTECVIDKIGLTKCYRLIEVTVLE